mmetsp:Transcript_40115/g.100751  ORF Transcript_40115/g.100751 Transcript_40115/m.100751 type:complete len:241 (+) Transcript_40115:289-1011(+)
MNSSSEIWPSPEMSTSPISLSTSSPWQHSPSTSRRLAAVMKPVWSTSKRWKASLMRPSCMLIREDTMAERKSEYWTSSSQPESNASKMRWTSVSAISTFSCNTCFISCNLMTPLLSTSIAKNAALTWARSSLVSDHAIIDMQTRLNFEVAAKFARSLTIDALAPMVTSCVTPLGQPPETIHACARASVALSLFAGSIVSNASTNSRAESERRDHISSLMYISPRFIFLSIFSVLSPGNGV